MQNMKEINSFLKKFEEWRADKLDILGVAYVGSWARNQAKPTSDLDLMIVTADPQQYLKENNWISNFGDIKEIKREDWDLVQSWRVLFENEDEIEFGITTEEWTNVPSDPGTARVVGDGMKIVYDPMGILKQLDEWVKANR